MILSKFRTGSEASPCEQRNEPSHSINDKKFLNKLSSLQNLQNCSIKIRNSEHIFVPAEREFTENCKAVITTSHAFQNFLN